MHIRVALVQFRVNADPVQANLQRMERYIKDASRSADVIVFPEYVLTGGGEDHIDDGSIIDRFRELAREHSIDLIPGSLLEETEKGIVNATYYIDHNGTIKGRYEKINLWHSERAKITPGTNTAIFETRFGPAGLALCWDLIRPDLFSAMARARIVYCPSLWFRGADMPIHTNRPDTQKMHLDALCRARAIENAMALVYVNGVGRVKLQSGYDDGIGQSMVTVPVRGIIDRMDEEQSMIITAIDLSLIDQAREAYGLPHH